MPKLLLAADLESFNFLACMERLIKCCSTISQDDEDDTALPGAHGDRLGVVLDHDQPPDRQHQGVPDGHGVHDVGEVDVEQEEHCPGVGILKSDNI